ncbi:hypothetical protein D3C75_941100 [compost metagenome]
MRIVKTQEDIDVLRRAGTLPAALLEQIEDYFKQLKDELEDLAGIEFLPERTRLHCRSRNGRQRPRPRQRRAGPRRRRTAESRNAKDVATNGGQASPHEESQQCLRHRARA